MEATAGFPGTDGPIRIGCARWTAPGAIESASRASGSAGVASPAADQFANSSITVTAGSVVSFALVRFPKGRPPPRQDSLVMSVAPGALPGFGSNSVVDQNCAYAVECGDSELVRINKNTDQRDEVGIPMTSDTQQPHSLALSGGKLYFTLSDDDPPSFGAASTFGYVDIAAWEAASAPCLSAPRDCGPAPALRLSTPVFLRPLSRSGEPLTSGGSQPAQTVLSPSPT
jgi:hypothetical protein